MRPQQKEWEAAQAWERNWWLNNPQMYAIEIQKSAVVAGWLGIQNMPHKNVVDIGCGPFSLLQRFTVAAGCAVDPIDYGPLEIGYKVANIRRVCCRGEDIGHYLSDERFDEAWIYNCLQHVEDPAAILQQAIKIAERVRLFEWVNIPPYTGHLQLLTAAILSQPFFDAGWDTDFSFTGRADFDGLNGDFYVGVFRQKELS
jgi:SAM-dependent methyltransferase